MSRERLIEQLSTHIGDRRVLAAIAAVPRDLFVPPSLRSEAWDNTSLPIGHGQTISQPSVVARMCELLELDGSETVLDVGTGSGYHAAVLARLAARVVSIERQAALSLQAREALREAGAENVTLPPTAMPRSPRTTRSTWPRPPRAACRPP
jgi:protein-L-isoaspartate(D-aspartate) O-methyltransferase